VHFLNGFEGIFGELSSSPIISYVTLLSLEIISVQEKMTKINTVTTRQLGEMTIVGAFRLSGHSGPLYYKCNGSSSAGIKKRHRRDWAHSHCTGGVGEEEPRSEASSQVESEVSEPPPFFIIYMVLLCNVFFVSIIYFQFY
jgi:hypothetical protein